MRQLLLLLILSVVLGFVAFGFQGQTRPPQATSTADPYLNNAAPGTTQFPLAAPGGKDSNSSQVAPAGAVNQGPFDPAKWKYGTAFNHPEGEKIWTPVKLKMMKSGKVAGCTLTVCSSWEI